MNVSAADILTVATYLWGSYDSTESFASMAQRIAAERPADWKRLMRASARLRDGGVVHDYMVQAEMLRTDLGK